MASVRLRVSRELLEQLLCLGERTILGVSMEPLPGGVLINDVAVFVAMVDPGWR